MFFIQNLVNESLKYVKILKKNFCYFSSPSFRCPPNFPATPRPFCAVSAPPARAAAPCGKRKLRAPTKRRSREKKLSARRSAPRIRQGGGSYNFKKNRRDFPLSGNAYARNQNRGKSANLGIQATRATCCAFFCARASRRGLLRRLSPRATSAF